MTQLEKTIDLVQNNSLLRASIIILLIFGMVVFTIAILNASEITVTVKDLGEIILKK